MRRKRQGSSDPYSVSWTLTTFNTELAALSGQTEGQASNKGAGVAVSEGGVGVQVDAQGRCMRINSMEGRREGWLAPAPV